MPGISRDRQRVNPRCLYADHNPLPSNLYKNVHITGPYPGQNAAGTEAILRSKYD